MDPYLYSDAWGSLVITGSIANLAGEIVAASRTDLWSSSPLLAGVKYAPYKDGDKPSLVATIAERVWTGSIKQINEIPYNKTTYFFS